MFAFNPSDFCNQPAVCSHSRAVGVYYFALDHPNIYVKYATVEILAYNREYYTTYQKITLSQQIFQISCNTTKTGG
jgi:hypothetical protein